MSTVASLVVAFALIGPAASAQVDPTTYAGVYTVSETDLNTTRCAPTPFRAALAAGQPGPDYQYRVRVMIAAPDVNFSAENGGAVLFSAMLTTEGKFTEKSGTGFSVVGEFASGGFRMTWVRPQGAGNCTTEFRTMGVVGGGGTTTAPPEDGGGNGIVVVGGVGLVALAAAAAALKAKNRRKEAPVAETANSAPKVDDDIAILQLDAKDFDISDSPKTVTLTGWSADTEGRLSRVPMTIWITVPHGQGVKVAPDQGEGELVATIAVDEEHPSVAPLVELVANGVWKGKQMTETITVRTSSFELRLS
jgi:hypothetical protein